MFLDFDDRDIEAAEITLRTIGAKVPKLSLDIRQAHWSELHKLRSEARTAAKKGLDAIKACDEERELKKLQTAHDILLAAIDEAQSEMELRDSYGQKEPLGPAQRGAPIGEAMTVGGGTGERVDFAERSGWSDRNGSEIRVLRPEDSFRDSTTGAYTGPGFGTILRALVTGPRSEEEKRALAEGTDSAGGFTVPTPLAAWYIDKLRAASVVIKAGARTVPMSSETLSIARLATDPTMAWRAENASIGESSPTFESVQLQAKSLAGMVKVSRELLDDSVNVGEILENAFIRAAAVEFDRACLFGSGASSEPEGLDALTGVTSVSMGTNGAAMTNYDKLIDTIYELKLANAGEPTALIWHPRTERDVAKLKDVDNNPLRVPEMVAKVPKLQTTSVEIDQTQGTATDASPVLIGDFRRMLIGLRSNLRIEVAKERYAENHQFGFFAFMRGDVQFEHKASFAKLVGIIPA